MGDFPIPASTTLLTESEAALRLGWDAAEVRRLCRMGGIPFLPGRPIRIAAVDLQEYMRRNQTEFVEHDDIGEHMITAGEIALRLNIDLKGVGQFLDRRGVPYERIPMLVVSNRVLWEYLIETKHVRRSAFGPEPLHPEAEAAFTKAIERLVSERLSEITYEDELRARRSESTRNAAIERASRKKAAAAEKARRAAKRGGASRRLK